MLVAYHGQSGDQAVAAMLPQIIGTIHTAVGCGTLTRADGVAVQVIAGDVLHQGDVIETASDGQIAISMFDGTRFMLSCDTRVVLDGLVGDADGVSPSALFAVDRGSFAFMAGRAAKTGSLRIDTPVGSIRGRAHAGGFGMLSLTALTFATMSDVRAADPDATFLDDDSIAYKDFEHGAFELWTKEAIPRHIIVEDPGETVVLTQRGSSVSVSQVANSPARMEELQTAQQAVLANYARGYGPGGSSTPYYLDLPKPQPINNVPSGGSIAPGELPPLPEGPRPVVIEPFILPPPPPVPPTLNAATGPTLIDTAALDLFTASGGSFAASSSQAGAALTFGIDGGTAGNTVVEGITYNISRTGLYGTLFLNSTTGAYLYVPESAAVNALSAPTTENITITVSDGTLSASQTYTVIINGTNDAAIITGSASGAAIEAGGVANAAPGTPTATGTLFDIDVDNPANTFTAIGSATPSEKGYGTFTMTAAGVWAYTLVNTNPAVQALNVGDTLTDTFTVTTVDGTAQVVTITITGTNDAAVISGTTTGAVIEAGGCTPGASVATGRLTDIDVDNEDNSFIAVTAATPSSKGYGTFTMTAAGAWTYTLDNTNPAVQALNVGGTLTDSFTVATADGTIQVVTIAIAGANDAAVISGTTTGSVTEAGTTTPGTPIATGTLTDTDVDNAANTFTAVSSPTATSKGYGTFMMTATGVWAYMLDNGNCAVQALDPCETLTDTFTVTTIDGTPQTVTIVIHGSSDADPNDFDNLALGKHVIIDPPYVYGTPNGENIAGGGHECQIVYAGAGNDTVNGTGKNDTLYSGSGNDTIKGNDGNDTIYGGSGNDTVNGNNGSDTITGGFGADQLTGSNGNDVFVYLSVADSNATQFDTITDFASRSDKINLAALGALTFVHLTSSSTSVPPNTIAWIYNSAGNETIVYVNRTGETLNIGDSSLLEIHLQGIASVQESDFVYQAAANSVVAAGEAIDLSLQLLAAEGAVLAAASAETFSETSSSTEGVSAGSTGGWTLQAEDAGFKFRLERDGETIGSARLGHFSEAPAHAAADAEDAASMTLTAASPVEPWHHYTGTAMESQFTFQQEPSHAGTVAISEPAVISPLSTIEPPGLTVAQAVATSQHAEHGVEPGANASAPQPQDPHTAHRQAGFNDHHSAASWVATSQFAQLGVTPGGGTSPHQSKHEPHTSAPHTWTNDPHSPSAPLTTALSHHHAPANVSETPTLTNPGSSFHFKNEIAASKHTEPTVPLQVDLAAAWGRHGHNGPAATHEIAATSPSPAEEHIPSQVHVASHGAHELLV